MNSITEEIRKFVEEECKKPSSKYGYDPYLFHFLPTLKYAKILAEQLHADVEIVEIAALLHDLGSIIHGREDHHITSSEIAEKKLRELSYPEEKIKKIKQCIISHRGSKKIIRETAEAQIIADADAMSAFDNIAGIFQAAFIYENKNQEESKKSVKQKLINSFDKLSPQAREIIKPKFDAAMLLLS